MKNLLMLSALASLLLATGCRDDDDGGGPNDTNGDAEAAIEEPLEELGARAAAETVRANLRTRDLDEGDNLRDISVLEAAVEDLPGSPEASGLEDTSGDGQDDDGLVEIRVGNESACLSVGEDNETVDVTGGACGSG